MDIVCRSGFAGVARRLKGQEIQTIADQLEGEDDLPDEGIGAILSGCWLETTEAGPYRFLTEGDTKPEWIRLAKGDVMSTLHQLRAGSFRDGEAYDFDVKCDHCREQYGWTINLRRDVIEKEQEMSDEERAYFEESRDLVFKLFNGTEIRYQPATIALERPMQKLRQQQKRKGKRLSTANNILDRIASQILSVGGKKLNIKQAWDWVAELDQDDMFDVRDAMDANAVGFNRDIKTRCSESNCRWKQVVDLPLNKHFFVRKRRSQSDDEDEQRDDQDEAPSSSPKSDPKTEAPTP